MLAALLAGAACGGTDRPEGTSATTPSTTDAITTFSTARFEVPFTLELPENWTASERDVDLVQFWMGPSEMASPLEISISFDVVGTPEEVMAAYSSIDGTTATEPQVVSYGGFDALQLELEVQQDGPRIPGGYRMGVGGRARFAAIDTGARTFVTIPSGSMMTTGFAPSASSCVATHFLMVGPARATAGSSREVSRTR